MVGVVTKFARVELLYDDDIAVMSKTNEGLRNKFLKWKEAFESKGLKVNLGVPMVNLKTIKLSSKVDTCVVCSIRAKANSAYSVVNGFTVDVLE